MYMCVRVYMLCFVLCVYCVDIDYPIVTSLSATQETAAHPDAAQVEAQKQLEEERLDVCYHTLDAYTVCTLLYSHCYNNSVVQCMKSSIDFTRLIQITRKKAHLIGGVSIMLQAMMTLRYNQSTLMKDMTY